ncbi:hypothetical protein ACFW9L_03380 [Streptomyces sp. NPDC059517]|uniref:hypothetical protein n=1 Tax=Streptomyces sp. NPDC059517 TaxID=3346855 RepID=UPI0036A0033B
MRAWVAEQDWLSLERLPDYAPELNPVELLVRPSRPASWPTSPTTTSPTPPTRPNGTSTGSAQTNNSRGSSSPTPICRSILSHYRTNENLSSRCPRSSVW